MKTSYNGWTASPDPDAIGVVPFVVNGVPFPGGVRSGNVHTVLHHVMEQFDKRVERLQAVLGCWGFAYRQNRNADNLSCHSSATAVDANAVRHPNGKRRTFTREQVAEIRKILAEVGDVVRWGGDFDGTPDEMHFEVVGSPPEVATVARRLVRPNIPSPRPMEDEMTPADWQRFEALLDEKLRIVERAETAEGKPTGHANLRAITSKLDAIATKLGIKP